ncbi:uncharacterized protein CDV56_104800 [Aspergillus thermomutatus]|uniref:Uncharacterized protein n=1 Tax=Aspergillus thermomutatus TaxID=41047 RepID=A0A397GA94_ASPTH|nr:uncharacterized protein CDV56_104800 [Aspergillus thermomutatus]RHZ46518.1 hypothetical protein CDV56_104800 [Aspergillus thermomutatus]
MHHRLLATKPSPGNSSNAADPVSSNPESQAINKSRGKEARHSDAADTRSVQSPVSAQGGRPSEAHEGEEQTSADAMIKNIRANRRRRRGKMWKRRGGGRWGRRMISGGCTVYVDNG